MKKLLYEQYCDITHRQHVLMNEGLKETIAAFMLSLGIIINTGCISMDPTENIYPPTPGESDPGGYKKYKHHIKPWLDLLRGAPNAYGSAAEGGSEEAVSCEPKSNVKKNPWYDYTHPWLKFTKHAGEGAVPEIAIQQIKKKIGTRPKGMIVTYPGGEPPNPNEYQEKYKNVKDKDAAFRSWYSETFWYFQLVQKYLPQVMEDIKKKSL